MSSHSSPIQSEYSPYESYAINIAAGCLVFVLSYLLVFVIIAYSFQYNIFIHGWVNFFVIVSLLIMSFMWAKQGYDYEKTHGELGPQDVALVKTFGTLPDEPIRLINGKFATIPKIILWDIVEFVIFYIGPEPVEVVVKALTSDGIEVNLKVRIIFQRSWDQLLKWAGFKANYVEENIGDFVAEQSAPLLQSQTFTSTQTPEAIRKIKEALLTAIREVLPGHQNEAIDWGIYFHDVIVLPIETTNDKLKEELSKTRKEQAQKEAEELENAHIVRLTQINFDAALAASKTKPGWEDRWNPDVQWRVAKEDSLLQISKTKRIIVDGNAQPYVKGTIGAKALGTGTP